MAIVLHCAAGPAIGLGHLARSASVTAALSRLGALAHLLVEAPGAYPDLEAEAGGAPITRASDRAGARSAYRRLSCGGPGRPVLVTDLLDLTPADADTARGMGFARIVHLTDSGADRYPADLFIDTDAVPRMHRPAASTILAGATFHAVRPTIVAARPAEPWRPDRARALRRVLITLGGADPGHCTEALVEGLTRAFPQAPKPTPRFTLVAGPAFGEARRAALADTSSPEFALAAVDADMARLTASHDLIVTLGGETSYEAMCLGRPVACVRWAHMGPYVDAMARSGLVADLGGEPAGALLALVHDPAALASLARAGYESVDGGGADRCAAAIHALAMAA